MTAATRTMHAPADGYTIIMGNMGTHAAVVALYPAVAYNPRKDSRRSASSPGCRC